MTDKKTVNNRIMSQLTNNMCIMLQLFHWCNIRQSYTIKPPFPGRHFTFPITFAHITAF